jgi:hypothetical protein
MMAVTQVPILAPKRGGNAASNDNIKRNFKSLRGKFWKRTILSNLGYLFIRIFERSFSFFPEIQMGKRYPLDVNHILGQINDQNKILKKD